MDILRKKRQKIDWKYWRLRYVTGQDSVTLEFLSHQPGAPSLDGIKKRSTREAWPKERKDFRERDSALGTEWAIKEKAIERQDALRQDAIADSNCQTLLAVNEEILKRLKSTPETFDKRDLIKISRSLCASLELQETRLRSKSKLTSLRFSILNRDCFTCQYCGRSPSRHGVELQVDHIIPKSKGGDNSKSNLVTSCMECNLGKRDVLLHQKFLENK